MKRLFAGALVLMVPVVSGCTEKKDLSPPPLNPHPKEAVRIRVDFDNPEDAKRYTFTMRPLYQNQQSECGYIDNARGGIFVYPHGQFEIPNVSPAPDHAEFVVYVDRYNRETCNWELVAPALSVYDRHSSRTINSGFTAMEGGMRPGASYHATCLFISDISGSCWDDSETVPNVPHYARVSITVRVSEDSAPLRPSRPGYFSNFVIPVGSARDPNEADEESTH